MSEPLPEPVPTGLPIFYDLYGPESRSGAALVQGSTGGGYLWPGSALSASTLRMRFDLVTRRVAYARWLVVWTPNGAGNGIRLVHADDGPANVTAVAEFTGLSQVTPINSAADITDELNALIDGGALKQVGHQVMAGSRSPVIFASRLEVVWE